MSEVQTPYRNRIIGLATKPASAFVANPDHYHLHSVTQRRLIASVLGQLGFIGGAIENVRTGHLIDGHERVAEALAAGDQEVPYLQVDLSPEEEKVALATFDPVGRLAGVAREQHDALIAQISDEVRDTIDLDIELQRFFGIHNDILRSHGLVPEDTTSSSKAESGMVSHSPASSSDEAAGSSRQSETMPVGAVLPSAVGLGRVEFLLTIEERQRFFDVVNRIKAAEGLEKTGDAAMYLVTFYEQNHA